MGAVRSTTGRTSVVRVLLPSRVRRNICGRRVTPCIRSKGAVSFSRNCGVRFKLVSPTSSMGVIVFTPGKPKSVMEEACRRKFNVPNLITIRESTANSTLRLTLNVTGTYNLAGTNILRASFGRRARASLFNRRAILYNNVARLVGTKFAALIRTNCRPRVTCFRAYRRMGLVMSLVCRGKFTKV